MAEVAEVPNKVPEVVAVEKKLKKPRAPKGSKPVASHPSYLQMITEAISSLKERTGSSPHAIAKYIDGKYKKDLPVNYKKILTVQLRNLAKSGKLLKIKGSFKLSDGAKKAAVKAAKPAKPAAAKPKKVTKPATKKASTPKKKPAKAKTAAKPAAAKKAPAKAKTAKVVKPAAAKKVPAAAAAKKVVKKVTAVKKVKVAKSPAKPKKTPTKKPVAKKAKK